MLIQVGYEVAFLFERATPLLALGSIHPSLTSSVRSGDQLIMEPSGYVDEYLDGYGNRCSRTIAPAGHVVLKNSAIVDVSEQPDTIAPEARQHPVDQLPHATLQFLLASRYCEVDSDLKDAAWSLFGHLPAGWSLVQSVCDFVHHHIQFDYQQASATRTAGDVYRERVGVCRDYMHLAITFCRSLNIPARYCTGYLGDIGVPPSSSPMDFSAWFEVYLGSSWYAFDARNNQPRIGRILMARGRDAVDAALTTTFGRNQLQSFQVWTDLIAEQT